MRKLPGTIAFFICLVGVLSCSRRFEAEFPALPDDAQAPLCRISLKLSDGMASAVEDAVACGDDPLSLFGENAAGCSGLRRMFPYAAEREPRHIGAGLHRWYSVCVPGSGLTRVKSSLTEMEGISEVSVQPRLKVCGSFPFNDKLSFLQWGLYNTGSVGGYVDGEFTPGIDINVVPVWEKYTGGSPDVTVAVVDGGVFSHSDIKGALIPAGENGSRNFVDKYRSTPYVIVPEIHATAVSSIIASVNNNGDWFCGVAGGSDGTGGVRILNCQILASDDSSDDTFSTDNIGEAIVWAADHGAVICNNSWGFDYEEGESVPEETPGYISDAIDYFCDYAGIDLDGRQTAPMRGGLVVFAAGNENSPLAQPAMYERVVSVGAIGPRGERADYSNYGDWVDICAPGGNMDFYKDVLGDDSKYAMIAAPGIDDESIYLNQGTSMACPYVSGVAALMVSYFGGEGFTATKLREMLLRGADFSLMEERDRPVGPMLDAMGAFSAACASPVKPEGFSVTAAGSSLVLGWRVTGTGGEPTYACKAQVSRTADFADVLEKVFITADRAVSDQVYFEFPGLGYDTEYYVRLYGMGVDRNDITSPTEVIRVQTGPDVPPVLAAALPDVILDGAESEVRICLDDYFSEPSGEKLEYSVLLHDARPLAVEVNKNLLILRYADYGQTEVTVSATDYAGNKASDTFRSLSRESSKRPFDLYPVPVADILHVRPGEAHLTEFRVRITAISGSSIFDSLMCGSAFEPAEIDMSACGPGVYNVTVTPESGESYSKSIVKK